MEMNIQLAEKTSRIYIERDCRLHLEKYISLD